MFIIQSLSETTLETMSKKNRPALFSFLGRPQTEAVPEGSVLQILQDLPAEPDMVLLDSWPHTACTVFKLL